MDFIERLLHVSPDAGSGTLEATYAFAAALVAALYWRRRLAASLRRVGLTLLRRRS